MSPPKRSRFWKAKRVFFVTPQVFEKDIQSGICLVRQLVCLVFDEAHRAMGNYSYCVAVRELMAMPVQLRILALTATPGSKHQTIQKVIDNLCISTLEYRHESDRDVSPYVHSRKLELIEVPMGKDAIGINSILLQAIQPFVARLRDIVALPQRDFSTLSPSELLNLRDKFRQAPPHNLPTSRHGEIEANFCALITFYHIRKLLSSHGIRPAYEMLQEKLKKGSFSKLVSKIEAFWKAKLLMEQSLSHGAPTPKMVKLLEILVDHFKTKNPNDSRVIIFSNFRGSVRDIMNYLSNIEDMIKATEFIGQSSGKTLKGQTQKVQQAVLEKFRSGGFNVIVATSIGEEGLDIMEVDLVICFDANVSPLRMIQRMGRTGRKNDGRVVILACEGSELKAYLKKKASSKAMRKHMHNGGITSFNFHPSPRMVPHICKPQVQYLEMSIERFIPRGKKVKNAAIDRSPFSRNISNEELNLISKYFPQSGDATWKPSLIAFPSFQALSSQVSRVRHSFKTTAMFIEAMQDLQGLSFSKVNNDSFIEVETSSQPQYELSTPRDNIRQGPQDSVFHCTADGDGAPFQVSTGEVLEVKVSSPRPQHAFQKRKPHCFLFGEGSVILNSLGSVLITCVPVLQHKGSKYSEAILTENGLLTEGPKPKNTNDASSLKLSGNPTMQVENPEVKASTDLQQSNNGPLSSLFIQATRIEQENVKHLSKMPDCKLKHREPADEPATGKNSNMEDVLPSSVGRSRNEATYIELSPRLTHFIKEGIVPESPVLNVDHHLPTVEKNHFLSHSLEDDKDTRCQGPRHVDKLSVVMLDALSVNDSFSMNEKEMKIVKNTMFENTNDSNIACTINEAVQRLANTTNAAVHTPKTMKHSSSEDWKCNSGEASISFFQAPKYKRLRKHGDVIRKLPVKTLHKRFKLVEKTRGSALNTEDNELNRTYGEKEKAIRHVDAFVDEEAEVSGDASVSEDELVDEKNDQYDDSFIDDRINPTEGSAEAENSEVDMIAFYRRSLLTQSPMVLPAKFLPTSHEPLSSGTAGSCSPDKKINLLETPQDGLLSVNQLDDKNSAICNAASVISVSGEAGNHSERCSDKLESRKRKLFFQPSDAIPKENLNSQLRCQMQSAQAESNLNHPAQAERNLNHPPKVAKFDAFLSFDDDFYQDLDLDEVEAQATKLLRFRSESSFGKSQSALHDHSAQIDEVTNTGINFICSPKFDLGI
ncbi:DEAD-box ATP-dependent RNA helicase FANCM isoform X3 [Dendrobium catenatum]|nr:DEAD-box ATP-dependent RNA helicase FANCM isoform X3 [Dendrobium catenatum]